MPIVLPLSAIGRNHLGKSRLERSPLSIGIGVAVDGMVKNMPDNSFRIDIAVL
jgi:hypothetical protein